MHFVEEIAKPRARGTKRMKFPSAEKGITKNGRVCLGNSWWSLGILSLNILRDMQVEILKKWLALQFWKSGLKIGVSGI